MGAEIKIQNNPEYSPVTLSGYPLAGYLAETLTYSLAVQEAKPPALTRVELKKLAKFHFNRLLWKTGNNPNTGQPGSLENYEKLKNALTAFSKDSTTPLLGSTSGETETIPAEIKQFYPDLVLTEQEDQFLKRSFASRLGWYTRKHRRLQQEPNIESAPELQIVKAHTVDVTPQKNSVLQVFKNKLGQMKNATAGSIEQFINTFPPEQRKKALALVGILGIAFMMAFGSALADSGNAVAKGKPTKDTPISQVELKQPKKTPEADKNNQPQHQATEADFGTGGGDDSNADNNPSNTDLHNKDDGSNGRNGPPPNDKVCLKTNWDNNGIDCKQISSPVPKEKETKMPEPSNTPLPQPTNPPKNTSTPSAPSQTPRPAATSTPRPSFTPTSEITHTSTPTSTPTVTVNGTPIATADVCVTKPLLTEEWLRDENGFVVQSDIFRYDVTQELPQPVENLTDGPQFEDDYKNPSPAPDNCSYAAEVRRSDGSSDVEVRGFDGRLINRFSSKNGYIQPEFTPNGDLVVVDKITRQMYLISNPDNLDSTSPVKLENVVGSKPASRAIHEKGKIAGFELVFTDTKGYVNFYNSVTGDVEQTDILGHGVEWDLNGDGFYYRSREGDFYYFSRWTKNKNLVAEASEGAAAVAVDPDGQGDVSIAGIDGLGYTTDI